MHSARTVLILLLVMSLPVSALGALYGPMPCADQASLAHGDRVAVTAHAHNAPHRHPAQPLPAVDDGAVDDSRATGGDPADHFAHCPCGTDCDLPHCAGVNHTTAGLVPGHLLAVVTASASPAHRQLLRANSHRAVARNAGVTTARHQGRRSKLSRATVYASSSLTACPSQLRSTGTGSTCRVAWMASRA